ncbi:MAG: serine/threonine-protein kinase [Acidimicrobiales bacterium]|nr:serine/threonine-protein kinase [Acidimicrobiales bacterium]
MDEKVTSDLGIEGLQDPVEIGVGGFATVYKAYQPAFRRTVAVKVLAALNLDEAAKERFERECQAMGALSEHPNIVTVYGAGFTTSGRPYLVMAYLPGGALAERLEKSGPLSWQEATLIGVHLAGALETAHRAEIIHRDIKPGNVLVSQYGDAQLTDFGIARISGGHETRSGVITASMAHAPPEVLDGQRPSILADVYSLGSTIFELIYGAPAFQAEGDESMVPMLRRILTEPPPDLRQLGVPDSICQVIERAMAKEPGMRQQSALEFGRELQAARRAEGLDPGKLTVPAEISLDLEGEKTTINLVASNLVCSNCGAALTPGAEYCSECGTQVPDALRLGAGDVIASAPTGAVHGSGGVTVPSAGPGAVTQPGVASAASATSQVGTYGAGYGLQAGAGGVAVGPRPEPVKRSRRGLLIGVAALIVALVVVGAFIAITRPVSKVVETADSSTTTAGGSGGGPSSTTPGGTSSPAEGGGGYTPAIERAFIDRCAEGGTQRSVCRCVFEGLKARISFDDFRELNERAKRGEDLSTTEFGRLVQQCNAPASTSTGPTIGGLGGPGDA